MKLSGLLLIFLSLAVPLVWFVPLYQARPDVAFVSQYLGATALIVMAIGLLLSTRFALLEHVFGPLDKIYVLHKWLGLSAVAMIWLHETIDAEVRGLGAETTLSDLAESFGEQSLNGLLVLCAISVATFIPYHWWKLSHRLIGLFFALGALHFIFILKPMALADPVSLYLLGFSLLGLLSYLYTQLPDTWLRLPHRHKVVDVASTGDITVVRLAPENSAIKPKPGQFAFIKFDLPGAGEIHPFTISTAASSDGIIQFSIKKLGRGTTDISAALTPGTAAWVSGPFGRFSRPTKRPQIWVAGGVGITPFVSMLQTLPAAAKVHLFYCVRDESQAVHLAEFQQKADADNGFQLTIVRSRIEGRLTARAIAQKVAFDVHKAEVFFCGPVALRETLRSGLAQLGVARRRFHYEAFEIRTGIGLGWIVQRVAKFIKLTPQSARAPVER